MCAVNFSIEIAFYKKRCCMHIADAITVNRKNIDLLPRPVRVEVNLRHVESLLKELQHFDKQNAPANILP